jgi:Phage gp6-like head-tail connector protein
MTATVFYDDENEIALATNTFLDSAGSAADPTLVSCVITDPSGTSTTYTYEGASPATIVRVSTGVYTLSIPCSPAVTGVDGLWGGEWIGTGAVSDVQPFTWRVFPADTSQLWYIGIEEFKDRLGITEDTDDFQIQLAIQAASAAVNEHCGRHFNRITETRTFEPRNIWLLEVDDIVPGASIQVNVDLVGDGVFRTPYTLGVDYQLRIGYQQYNVNAYGVPRPYRQLQIINSGNWWPFTWPYTHLDRVQIITTWGWTYVPPPVVNGTFLLAAQLFRLKDAPFGVGGGMNFGTSVRSQEWAASSLLQGDPTLVQMFWPYINPRRKVGV